MIKEANLLNHTNHTNRTERLPAFQSGVRDVAPILLGVIPFGLIYGVIVNSAGLSGILGQAMSTVIFAGSAQLITTQLFGSLTPALIIIATAAVLNLRHLLYSASIAPFLQDIGRGWKIILSYLLTDEAYAIVIIKFEKSVALTSTYRIWYFLGVGLGLWVTWHISTAIGIFVGGQIPASWGLDFSVPLTFIALVVPAIRDRAGAVAMLVAGAAVILLASLPLKLGLLSAMLLGILAGYAADLLISPRKRIKDQVTRQPVIVQDGDSKYGDGI